MGTEKCATLADHIPTWDAVTLQLNQCMILNASGKKVPNINY